MKKFHGHHMLSLSLSLSLPLSLSLLADADPESFDPIVFVLFHAVLVDEGREDPSTTKAGRYRPASESLGSSKTDREIQQITFIDPQNVCF